ncbi:MAG: AAA family ATPase [Candidatus Brocadiaceae bacterium]|nr:AAA family ATPase [Candidatus Brocadiaceae bacterium]
MYRSFYSLTGKPFQLSPDSRFFFSSKSHNRAMAYLRYGLEKREGFIVITGGIGTGKTLLARTLFNEMDPKEVVAAQLVTTQVNPDDMLRIVCASFGLENEGLSKGELLDNLNSFLKARDAEGKRVLLIVDEAQNLPENTLEELRMLSNYQLDGKSLLQSFLLGQNELDQTLQLPSLEQFRQRIIAALNLKPLGHDETKGYIEHRLHQVGWENDPSISEDAFSLIHDFTNGTPRRVNSLCDRLFLFGSLEELHEITGEHVSTVINELEDEGLGSRKDTTFQMDSLSSIQNSMTAGTDVASRLSIIEEDIVSIKNVLVHEKKLLRKSILLQMDINVDDEVS